MTAQTRNFTVCVPKTYTENVAVTKTVMVPVVTDACGTAPSACAPASCSPCGSSKKGLLHRHAGRSDASASYAAPTSSMACQTVTEMHAVTKTVMHREMRSETINVPVTSYQSIAKTGTRTVNVMVPVTKQVTTPVTTYQTVAKTGTRTVNVNVAVNKEVTYPVTTYQTVAKTGTRTVNVCNPVTKEVSVAVTKCVPVTEKATKTVYTTVPVVSTVQVSVAKCVPVTKTATKTVCETVPVTKEVEHDVTSYKTEKKTGTKTVMSTVSVTEMRTENYTENVAYTETVQVAAAGCGAASSVSYASPDAAASTCGSARGGLLKGLFGKKARGGCGASKGCN